ncbi:hypothetical protein [Risungbinella massiliensis]|uniref:hypothetical protein n=1 Tax=Risungbinella massiliensis TaxID=1329796 RepID=UPI0005CC0555|nr:hypothetical protein [Risungbinella massiliensis]
MSLLNALTSKKPKIVQGFSFIRINRINSNNEIVKLLSTSKNHKYQSLPKNITRISVSYHAYKRWNTRVGPPIEYRLLSILLNQLLLIPGRIKLISPTRGIIDSDIVFICSVKSKTLLIKTFYGRRSLQPAILNIKEYRYTNHDTLALDAPPHIIKSQKLPILPSQFITFRGNITFYELQKFDVHHHDDQEKRTSNTLFTLKKTGKIKSKSKSTLIDPSDYRQPLLNNNVLFILRLLGYKEFILNHLKHHKPEKVERAKNHAKKKKS